MTVRLIGWTLVHALWQGGLIAIALAVVLTVARRAPATARYLIAVAALALAAILPVATAMQPVWRPLTAMAGATALVSAQRFAAVALEPLLPHIVVLWAAGLLLFAIRLAGGAVRVRDLARYDTLPVSAEMRAVVTRAARQLGIRGVVGLAGSWRVDVPVVIGVLRPMVLLPATLATGLTAPQLEALIAHELAHVRRHDGLVNAVQCVLETIFFFQPAIWWISDQVREEREKCCDDLAVRLCRGDVITYTSALLALEERRGGPMVLATAANGGSLLRRVRRLVAVRHGAPPAPEGLDLGARWCGALVLAVVGLLGMESTLEPGPARDGPPRHAVIPFTPPSRRDTPVAARAAVYAPSRTQPVPVVSLPIELPLLVAPIPIRSVPIPTVAAATASAQLGQRERDRGTSVLDSTIDSLIERVHTSQRGRRSDALNALARIDAARAVAFLASVAADHSEERLGRQAVHALGESRRRGDARVALLALAQTHPRAEMRGDAIEALVELDHRTTAGALMRMAEGDPDARVQRAAVSALGDIRPNALAIDSLVHVARSHPRGEVRYAAVRQIGGFERERRARAALVDLSQSSGDSVVRAKAFSLLRRH